MLMLNARFFLVVEQGTMCNAPVFAHLAGKVDAVVDVVEIDLVVNLLQVLLNRLLDQ